MLSETCRRVVVIGIGNEFRSDDAAGLLAARRLRTALRNAADVLEHVSEGTLLFELWEDADLVFLIDAVDSSNPPGTIHRIDLTKQTPAELPHMRSTHSLGVPESLRIARMLGKIPNDLKFYGIEGESFADGISVTPEVGRAIAAVAGEIEQDILGHRFEKSDMKISSKKGMRKHDQHQGAIYPSE